MVMFGTSIGGGPALYVSDDDWPALERAMRKLVQGTYTFPALSTDPMIAGVRIIHSALIPAGRALLVDHSGRPSMLPVTDWADVLATVTALALAGVDERFG